MLLYSLWKSFSTSTLEKKNQPQNLHNKKEKLCSGMDWKYGPAQNRGKSPLSCVCGGEITLSSISGLLRGVRVVKSLE